MKVIYMFRLQFCLTPQIVLLKAFMIRKNSKSLAVGYNLTNFAVRIAAMRFENLYTNRGNQ